MWSDTGSFEYQSKGDVTKTLRLDSFNFDGPVEIDQKRKGRQMLELSATPEVIFC